MEHILDHAHSTAATRALRCGWLHAAPDACLLPCSILHALSSCLSAREPCLTPYVCWAGQTCPALISAPGEHVLLLLLLLQLQCTTFEFPALADTLHAPPASPGEFAVGGTAAERSVHKAVVAFWAVAACCSVCACCENFVDTSAATPSQPPLSHLTGLAAAAVSTSTLLCRTAPWTWQPCGRRRSTCWVNTTSETSARQMFCRCRALLSAEGMRGEGPAEA